MIYDNDTITAVSTAAGTGAIGIVRISGAEAVQIAEKIFHGKKKISEMGDHTISYGKIADPSDGEILDEVMLTKMLAPATYTREDIIEINCHGSIISLRKILDLILSLGARAAEPGEFTKRAFLNGRIDLSQAEAVIDIINSKTSQSHNAALTQLEGKLSGELNNIIDKLINIMAAIEVTVDYPEHDDEYSTGTRAMPDFKSIISKLDQAIESFRGGKIIRNGVRAVITGKPNAGKSTLLNELSGYSRAIVTDIPGTTRDIIEEEMDIGGIPFIFTDTAGIRETEDIVEKFGVERAKSAVEKADLIMLVIDLTDPEPDGPDIINLINNKKCIVILNKKDLVSEDKLQETESRIKEIFTTEETRIIEASLLNEEGLKEIREAINDLLQMGKITQNNELMITIERHRDLIVKAKQSLISAMEAWSYNMPLDMLSIDIRAAADYIGEITGSSVSEDLVDKIFSTFCLGK